ncbi:MAG TPA: LysM peptidoglycan-binding domain-containing protein [Candidatus Sulfomarinibacteraceae bacterium]|nr:LysM peptidoglycan-binding domain-containing protein [Candidatus Sulfomarinibacteraceae bacterium]
MNRSDFLRRVAWSRGFVAIFLFSLLLVACERPLQEEVTLEPAPPAGEDDPLSDPSNGYPGSETEAPSGDLLPTPSPAAEDGAETGEPATDEPAATDQPGDSEGGAESGEAPAGEEPTGPTEDVIHTVVAGDTLGRLSEQYGVSIEAIAAANNLANIHSLEVGQQLLIPLSGEIPGQDEPGDEPAAEEERVHIVQAGETLFRIGQQYGFSVEALVAYNNLADPHRLEVGQQIRIPPAGYSP